MSTTVPIGATHATRSESDRPARRPLDGRLRRPLHDALTRSGGSIGTLVPNAGQPRARQVRDDTVDAVHPPQIRPTGATRSFGTDEVIVTKTDLQGRITYANDVFLRVAGYREQDVIGMPHNIIRHPDMPRAVFGLLWRELQAGREIFAYVDNLASDGAHYWVFAHVTPTRVRGRVVGYHSNRRVPDPAAVRAVAQVYRQLLDEERRHQHPVRAIEASTALLESILAGAGLTYDEWVWSLTGVPA